MWPVIWALTRPRTSRSGSAVSARSRGRKICAEQIEKIFNIDAIDIFGLTEVIGPGVSSECLEAKKGLHVFEDHFIPEIIDPETGEPLPYGEKGELVFTSITKEAFPVIRYRTRDISCLNPELCVCGRTFVRMERITGQNRRHAHYSRRQRIPLAD